MPKRIKEYCKKTGQKVPETKGEVVRCIAESLAFKYRQTVEGMEDVTGNKYNVVNIVGGGIKDKMICQFTANATKRVWVRLKTSMKAEKLFAIHSILKHTSLRIQKSGMLLTKSGKKLLKTHN